VLGFKMLDIELSPNTVSWLKSANSVIGLVLYSTNQNSKELALEINVNGGIVDLENKGVVLAVLNQTNLNKLISKKLVKRVSTVKEAEYFNY
jgi:hypothetical protein